MNNTNETTAAISPGNAGKPLAAILAEMRGNKFDDPHLSAEGIVGARRLARNWADRIETAVIHQFEKIRYLCQVEIDSAISDHISSIFMLKVVRDIAQDQLSSLHSTDGKEKANGDSSELC